MKVSEMQPPSCSPQPPKMWPSASESKVAARAPAIASDYQAVRQRKGKAWPHTPRSFPRTQSSLLTTHWPDTKVGAGVFHLSTTTFK